jgi:hypothetical protein
LSDTDGVLSRASGAVVGLVVVDEIGKNGLVLLLSQNGIERLQAILFQVPGING